MQECDCSRAVHLRCPVAVVTRNAGKRMCASRPRAPSTPFSPLQHRLGHRWDASIALTVRAGRQLSNRFTHYGRQFVGSSGGSARCRCAYPGQCTPTRDRKPTGSVILQRGQWSPGKGASRRGRERVPVASSSFGGWGWGEMPCRFLFPLSSAGNTTSLAPSPASLSRFPSTSDAHSPRAAKSCDTVRAPMRRDAYVYF